jgi:DNA invertase Pin-like site-specific DNA recombinase
MITKAAPRVVLYLRMSSDKQETSIDDQRKELTAYCKQRGYKIVREYGDEGVSGWKSKERRGFLQLIADAPAGDFDLVLCWDQSRFSRFDPVEAAHYWHILRREHVQLETIKEGRLDLDSLGGWLTASVAQHGKAEYVRSLAIDVARGQRAKRREGKWLTRAPLGYRIDENQKLVLGPDDEVEFVRYVFRLRAEGKGHRTITGILNETSRRAPNGGEWHSATVKAMLRRKTYLGVMVTGERSRPKFAPKDELRIVEGAHPAIIDHELWDKVRKLDGILKRRYTRTDGAGLKEGGALSGLVFCADCGGVMYSVTGKRKDQYLCSSYHSRGQCHHNQVDRELLLKVVSEKIKNVVLCGDLDTLTAKIEKHLAKRKSAPKIDTAAIHRQIAAIDRKLEGAADKLLSVNPSLVPTIEAKMLDLNKERAALEAKLTEEKPAKKPLSAKQIAANLWQLSDTLAKGKPGVVRQALSEIIDRIVIDFAVVTASGRGKGINTRRRATGATIFFCSKEDTQSGKAAFILKSSPRKRC